MTNLNKPRRVYLPFRDLPTPCKFTCMHGSLYVSTFMLVKTVNAVWDGENFLPWDEFALELCVWEGLAPDDVYSLNPWFLICREDNRHRKRLINFTIQGVDWPNLL